MRTDKGLRVSRRFMWFVALALMLVGIGLFGPWGTDAAYAGTPACPSGTTLPGGSTDYLDCVVVGNDKVFLIEILYDYPVLGQSTWFYTVVSGASPEVSHTAFELGGCLSLPNGTNSAGTWTSYNPPVLTAGGGFPSIGTDPITGVTGIKFDEGIAAGTARNYYVTVDGNYAGADIAVATKAGPNNAYDLGLITGPSLVCEDAQADFGDLPNPLPGSPDYQNTVYTDNGARHFFLPEGMDVILGLTRDAEGDGQEDIIANGDGGDEDGVAPFGTSWNTGTGTVVLVASGPGCVSAWLDWWDGISASSGPNGSFAEANEHIIMNQPVNAGTQYFSFPIDPGAFSGVAHFYSRFRIVPPAGLDSNGNAICNATTALTTTGAATGGEIEDHYWGFTPTAVTLQSAETAQTAAQPLWLAVIAGALALASVVTLRRRSQTI